MCCALAKPDVRHRRPAPRRPQARAQRRFTRSPFQIHQPPTQARLAQAHPWNPSLLPHQNRSRSCRSLLTSHRKRSHSSTRMTISAHKTSRIDSQGPTRRASIRSESALVRARFDQMESNRSVGGQRAYATMPLVQQNRRVAHAVGNMKIGRRRARKIARAPYQIAVPRKRFCPPHARGASILPKSRSRYAHRGRAGETS